MEAGGSEKDLADALALLLYVRNSDPALSTQYACLEGNQIIFRLLLAPAAEASTQVLKVRKGEITYFLINQS